MSVNSVETFLRHAVSSFKKGKSKEIELACENIMLCAITMGPDEQRLFEIIKTPLQGLIDSKSQRESVPHVSTGLGISATVTAVI